MCSIYAPAVAGNVDKPARQYKSENCLCRIYSHLATSTHYGAYHLSASSTIMRPYFLLLFYIILTLPTATALRPILTLLSTSKSATKSLYMPFQSTWKTTFSSPKSSPPTPSATTAAQKSLKSLAALQKYWECQLEGKVTQHAISNIVIECPSDGYSPTSGACVHAPLFGEGKLTDQLLTIHGYLYRSMGSGLGRMEDN